MTRARLAAEKIADRRDHAASPRDYMDGYVPGGRFENVAAFENVAPFLTGLANHLSPAVWLLTAGADYSNIALRHASPK